jgi:Transcription factor WhiB
MGAFHKTADPLAAPPWQGRRDLLPCQQPGVCADDWFGDLDAPETLRAIQLCMGCPIRLECRAWALSSGQQYGVWGGVSLHPSRLAG